MRIQDPAVDAIIDAANNIILQLLRDLRFLTGVNRFDIADRLLRSTKCLMIIIDVEPDDEGMQLYQALLNLDWQAAYEAPNGRVAGEIVSDLERLKHNFEERLAGRV